MPQNKTVSIGVVSHGGSPAAWWVPMANMVAQLARIGVEYKQLLHAGSMMVDGNRNQIVQNFVDDNKAEWLLWIDTDNQYRIGEVDRLFSAHRSLISGMYFAKSDPYNAIAYMRNQNNRYSPLALDAYTRGEIIEADMAGMGFLLSHRSVYTDLRDAYKVKQAVHDGVYHLVHKDDITGKERAKYLYNYKVHNGELRIPVIDADHELNPYPWFQITHNRTEDVGFFERAKRVGHQLWLDTSCEAGHLSQQEITGAIARAYHEKTTHQERQPYGYDVISKTTESA